MVLVSRFLGHDSEFAVLNPRFLRPLFWVHSSRGHDSESVILTLQSGFTVLACSSSLRFGFAVPNSWYWLAVLALRFRIHGSGFGVLAYGSGLRFWLAVLVLRFWFCGSGFAV